VYDAPLNMSTGTSLGMPGQYSLEAIRTASTWATALAAAWRRSAASTRAYVPRLDGSCKQLRVLTCCWCLTEVAQRQRRHYDVRRLRLWTTHQSCDGLLTRTERQPAPGLRRRPKLQVCLQRTPSDSTLELTGTCRKLKGFLKGVKVIVRYKGSRQSDRARPIRDLVEEAGSYPFECDGVEITVRVSLVDHFESPVLTRPFAGLLPEQASSGTVAHRVRSIVPLTRAV
jgi:hypothetical protein